MFFSYSSNFHFANQKIYSWNCILIELGLTGLCSVWLMDRQKCRRKAGLGISLAEASTATRTSKQRCPELARDRNDKLEQPNGGLQYIPWWVFTLNRWLTEESNIEWIVLGIIISNKTPPVFHNLIITSHHSKLNPGFPWYRFDHSPFSQEF